MSDNTRRSFSAMAVAIAVSCIAVSTSSGQENAVDNELERFKGHWRVIELVEDGNAIPETQMRETLPGGGVLEIVDYTMLFKSPMDGTKSTKSYRLDPTTYPKQIAILDRDKATGTGIYKFDQGKLVVCVAKPDAAFPTEFRAPAGTGRTLLIMSRFDPGKSEIPGMNVNLPARKPIERTTPPPAQSVNRVAPQPPAVAEVKPPAVRAPIPPIVADSTAGRILTDSEVRSMAIGTWRINDTEGSIDIVFGINGAFQTYRYFQTVSNFQSMFVPTPISSGSWSIVNGRLIAKVTSSTRADRVNQSFVPAVRSISATDMILVDHLGRVDRAVKLR